MAGRDMPNRLVRPGTKKLVLPTVPVNEMIYNVKVMLTNPDGTPAQEVEVNTTSKDALYRMNGWAYVFACVEYGHLPVTNTKINNLTRRFALTLTTRVETTASIRTQREMLERIREGTLTEWNYDNAFHFNVCVAALLLDIEFRGSFPGLSPEFDISGAPFLKIEDVETASITMASWPSNGPKLVIP